MFICDLRFDSALASKYSSGQRFAIVVGIRILCVDGYEGRWGCVGQLDFRMPTGGPVKLYSTGDAVLFTPDGTPFAILYNFAWPPASGATGAIGTGEIMGPPKPGIQYRHDGKWTALNIEEAPSLTRATWNAFCDNMSRTYAATEWYIDTTSGFSVAGGLAGYGGEYLFGTVVIANENRPNSARRLKYATAGIGYMTPGVGGTAAPEWMPNKGSYIVRGPLLPSDCDFVPEHLEGPCTIVDASASATAWIPFPRKVPKANIGAGADLSMFLFGTMEGLGRGALPLYRAAAVVIGLTGAAAVKSKWNAGLTINIGSMKF